MTATIADLRAGLASNLQSIPDVEVYEREGGVVNVPCIVVTTPTINYHRTFGNTGAMVEFQFTIMVLVDSASQEQQNWDMDEYVDNGSTKSVRAAIESDRTLGGVADSLVVTAFRPLSDETVAGIGYWGGSFDVTVYAR